MTYKTLLLAAACVALVGCGQPKAPAEAPKDAASVVTARPLPDTVAYPEGIAYDPDEGVYYTASAVDGAVVKVKVSDNSATLVVPGGQLVPAGAEFPAMLGMKLDEDKRLWLAGGVTGKLHVVDTKTGKTLTTLDTPTTPGGLLNDLTFTSDAAYVTDTLRPILWRVSRTGGQIGKLEPWLKLDPAIAYADGPNINGIVSTPDGKTLLLVQMNKGLLWKVDVATKAITAVDLKGALLGRADGLVLDGQRLYAICQETSEVIAVDLAADFASGAVVGRLKDDRFVAPATAFKTADKLFVVVTQFSKRDDNAAAKPFAVYEMPIAAIK